jgi:LEA14-like dessication related protein
MRSLIAFALIVVGLAACTKPQDLQFIDVQNVRMINLGLTESTVGLDVRFYNPNKQQVKLKDAAVKVYANSTYLGDTHMDSTITIPRRDTFSIPLTMQIPTLTAIGKVMQSLSDSTVDIKVDGTVKMGKAGVFINYPIHYERKQRLSDLNF